MASNKHVTQISLEHIFFFSNSEYTNKKVCKPSEEQLEQVGIVTQLEDIKRKFGLVQIALWHNYIRSKLKLTILNSRSIWHKAENHEKTSTKQWQYQTTFPHLC